MIGVVSSSLAIGATLFLLDKAWGFGSEELGAPPGDADEDDYRRRYGK